MSKNKINRKSILDWLENKTNQLYKVAYKIAKNNPFSKEYRSNKEPEVRAGPKNFQS